MNITESELINIINTLRRQLYLETKEVLTRVEGQDEPVVQYVLPRLDEVRLKQLKRIKQYENSLRLMRHRALLNTLMGPISPGCMYSCSLGVLYNKYVHRITSHAHIQQEAAKQQQPDCVAPVVRSRTVCYCDCTSKMAEMYLKLKNLNNPSFQYNPRADQHAGPYPDDSKREQSDCELCRGYTVQRIDEMYCKDVIPPTCMCSVEMAEFYVRNHLRRKYNPAIDYGIGPLPDNSPREASKCVWCRKRDESDIENVHIANSTLCLCNDETRTAMKYMSMFRNNKKWVQDRGPGDIATEQLSHVQCLKRNCRTCKPSIIFSPLQCPTCSISKGSANYFVFQADIIVYWLGCSCGQSSKFDISDLPWSFRQWQQRCVAEIYCHIFHVKSPSDMCEEVMLNAWVDDSKLLISNVVRYNQEARRTQASILYYQHQRQAEADSAELVSRLRLRSLTMIGSARKLLVSCLLSNKHSMPSSAPHIRTLKRERSIYNITKWACVLEIKPNKSDTLRCMIQLYVPGTMAYEALRLWLIRVGADPYSIVFFIRHDDAVKAFATMRQYAAMESFSCTPGHFLIESANVEY